MENTRKNWELLASAYQQIGREDLALGSLKEATSHFPTEGQLELSVAQLLYGDGNVAEANTYLRRAIDKGNLDKPGAAYLFLGFTAFELQKYEEAAECAAQAEKQSDIKPEDARRLARAVREAQKERAAATET